MRSLAPWSHEGHTSTASVLNGGTGFEEGNSLSGLFIHDQDVENKFLSTLI
jgi:hypothetical protein